MEELLPVLSGLCVGGLLGFFRPATRLWLAIVLAIVLGFLATVISGEYEISWGFLLIDIPLVAISTAIGLLVVRRFRQPTRSV